MQHLSVCHGELEYSLIIGNVISVVFSSDSSLRLRNRNHSSFFVEDISSHVTDWGWLHVADYGRHRTNRLPLTITYDVHSACLSFAAIDSYLLSWEGERRTHKTKGNTENMFDSTYHRVWVWSMATVHFVVPCCAVLHGMAWHGMVTTIQCFNRSPEGGVRWPTAVAG